jgi:threonine synthase
MENTLNLPPASKTMFMLDGISAQGMVLSKESLRLSEIVRDKTLEGLTRVEAYEDIINLEVGDTSLTRARNIERETGLRQLYIKFEGGNPTGTQKDRIAFAQCHDALRREYDTITMATCGNYGASVALAAKLAGLKCMIYIPHDYHTQRVGEMEREGAEVVRYHGSYEEAVVYSCDQAEKLGWYDANPGGNNTSLQLRAYAEIANEIYDQLRDAPRIVAVPVSNGTLLAGVYRGFVNLYKRGKTSRVPRMIGASSYNKNPIVRSFKKNFIHCEDLDPGKIRESKVNEPLINWHSFDGEEALHAIRESKGLAFDVSDERMLLHTRMLREKEGLHVLPASTVGLAALITMHQGEPIEPDRFVAILTGKR